MLLLSLVSCSDTQGATTEVTKSVVKIGKEILGGVNKGITEGRKEAEGIDGASMYDQRTLLLLDADGYALLLDSSNGHETDLKIPTNAGKKHSFLFNLRAVLSAFSLENFSSLRFSSERLQVWSYASVLLFPVNGYKKRTGKWSISCLIPSIHNKPHFSSLNCRSFDLTQNRRNKIREFVIAAVVINRELVQ
jgi:hypothetical protein